MPRIPHHHHQSTYILCVLCSATSVCPVCSLQRVTRTSRNGRHGVHSLVGRAVARQTQVLRGKYLANIECPPRMATPYIPYMDVADAPSTQHMGFVADSYQRKTILYYYILCSYIFAGRS